MSISIHRTRQQFAAAVNSLKRAVRFSAWRGNVAVENPALAAAQDFDQAVAAVLDECQPKTALFILRDDSGRGERTLRVYRIVASTKRYFYRQSYDDRRRAPMRRPILSPLVGLMMGGACALGVFGIGEGLWAIAFGTPAAVFAAQKAPANTPQSPNSPTGEKE